MCVVLAPGLATVSCSTQLLSSRKHGKKRTHYPHGVYFCVRTKDYLPGLPVCTPKFAVYIPGPPMHIYLLVPHRLSRGVCEWEGLSSLCALWAVE